MIFSDFYRSPRSPLSKLRLHHPQLPVQLPTTPPEWVADEYADLLSKDKSKQKDAVKRYLTDKVRNDWEFTWPPAIPEEGLVSELDEQLAAVELPNHDVPPTQNAEPQPIASEEDGYKGEEGTELDESQSDIGQGNAIDDDNDDAESVYSVMSEDAIHYRPRTEWTSDLSDDEDLPSKSSPFRFDNPESIQSTVQEIVQAKKARRRRALREEMGWNEGLACFEARRNAWTAAKTVRVRSKPLTTPPASPRSPRRFFFRRSMSGSPPNPAAAVVSQTGDSCGAISDSSSVSKDAEKGLQKHRSTDSSASDSTKGFVYPVETLLPIGQPLLPPSNPLRASISPAVYLSLYDKVILHNLQPACPINLSDMLRSCVAGWKRDGEWPPRGSAPDPMPGSRKKKKKPSTATNDNNGNGVRRLSFGILGRDRDEETGTSKGIRRSLQRALGIGVMAGMGEA
ncbi:mitochondrial AAA ATPase [Pochonia chlamydosporia 170]|uniref:Mitochondrial AAA ATPase n=1 Tax=Pochonia chlamydosporia 170 TaxID=1380566 RepID=A0A179G0X8_METCM|nr:mitochondrial AAA ATPase [Pochonia chlamydosporia 170]OAQ71120.1 mitochondrial AAA ATPase [Pochonia chlamydosporia 170]